MFLLQNVRYKNLLNYPDMEIPAGSTTFICGESGTGKSTLLKLLNGIVSPTEGAIYYLNKNINDYDPIDIRREILLISQAAYLFDMSVKENFNAFYSYRELSVPNDNEIEKFLNICVLKMSVDSQCSLLSGGERHRVFIAINLSFNSGVILLDEPTAALDDKNANKLILNLKQYCKEKGRTLIVVSHDNDLVEKYADNIITLEVKNG